MASESYHEPYDLIAPPTRDLHRAIVSLMEELEAIDWYQQRADACVDAELRAVLIHNKNEEIEHAMMILEWLRRNRVEIDENMRKYLFSQAPITAIEEEEGGAEGAEPAAAPRAAPAAGAGSSLGIGSLKGG